MGTIRNNRPSVFFFCAITYAQKEFYEKALEFLRKKWGNILEETEEYCFSDITAYYAKEMGSPLYKKIVFFEKPMELENLYQSKLFSNQTEDTYTENGIRNINLDPGYLTEAKVILFSTKDFAHRIYLGEGIFGEITLSYKAKEGFGALPWTFPDYKQEERLIFFNRMRQKYRQFLGKNKSLNK